MLGGPLDRLFQETFKVAKQVRTETAIGATSVSMAAAALKLAQQLFGDLRDTRLLLIGAGEMIELAAAHFTASAPKSVVVANRTLERGRELAARFHAHAITLQQLPERIHEFDIVISSTASTLPIIGKGMVESALKLRKHRPMFMVDLAVPRDIEAEVGDLDDVFLYTLDGLGKVIQQNSEKREGAVKEADAIIEIRVGEYMAWLASRATVPVIQQLRGKAEQYRQLELERAGKHDEGRILFKEWLFSHLDQGVVPPIGTELYNACISNSGQQQIDEMFLESAKRLVDDHMLMTNKLLAIAAFCAFTVVAVVLAPRIGIVGQVDVNHGDLLACWRNDFGCDWHR